MKRNEKEDLINYVREYNPLIELTFMDPRELILEENVKMNCFYCGRYNNNWKCPPNLPDIDYLSMFKEYDEGAFVSITYQLEEQTETYEEIRNVSSVAIHKTLLSMEKWMWNHNRANCLSFGAGACKLCRGGCGKDKCNNPYMARSPLEATGVNVIKSAKKYGINIEFPTDKLLKRVGLIIWQNN